MPKPNLLVLAAFQFVRAAAKDIFEMKPELAGMEFLKVQMNADLVTEDLKKKRPPTSGSVSSASRTEKF